MRACWPTIATTGDRKSTRLNSSHVRISYAVFCLKKKNNSIFRNRYDQTALQETGHGSFAPTAFWSMKEGMLLETYPPTRFSALFFFFNDTPTNEISTLSLHDALPI